MWFIDFLWEKVGVGMRYNLQIVFRTFYVGASTLRHLHFILCNVDLYNNRLGWFPRCAK